LNDSIQESLFLSSKEDLSPKIEKKFIEFPESYLGFPINFPYHHITGSKHGKKLVIISTIHGDELNGIQIIHKLTNIIRPQHLIGQIILIPVANVYGFRIQSRYLSDRRDLNRLFPGKKSGSEGSRLASFIWNKFIQDADLGIDLHSASYNRWNFPHIRGDMDDSRVRELASAFGTKIILHSRGVLGSLRRETVRNEIPFILFEAGQSNRFEKEVINEGVKGCWNVLKNFKMTNDFPSRYFKNKRVKKFYRNSKWIRSNDGGLFIPKVKPGEKISNKQVLGHINSLLGDKQGLVLSEKNGKVVGVTLHPQVIPGRALYHYCYNEEKI